MNFFEDLSTVAITCPHDDAFLPDGVTVYYRRVNTHPPTSDCFLPNARLTADDPCIGKSVSIFDNIPGLINAAFRTPAAKKKPRRIAAIALTPACGMLKQTFSAGHYSWWRSVAFNPAMAIPQTV